MIYHIVAREAWERARQLGEYRAESLEGEGFMHCSAREQITAVANAFYRGRSQLLLLCIDESRLRAELRWEAPAHPDPDMASAFSDSGAFPHIFGALNLDAVVGVFDFAEAASGFALPADLP